MDGFAADYSLTSGLSSTSGSGLNFGNVTFGPGLWNPTVTSNLGGLNASNVTWGSNSLWDPQVAASNPFGMSGSVSSFDWASIIRGATNLLGGAANAATSALNTAAPFLGLASSITAAGAQEAASYYQQGLLQVQAADTMRLAQLRTDQDRKYAALQAGRKLKAAEMLSMNYQIQGNSLLRNMERANAAVRARAAANGVAYGEGSAMAVQAANVGATYRDVGVSDLNALTARIMGYEDASAMLLAAEQQANLTMEAAETQARQLELAGEFAVKSGGLLSGASLVSGLTNFAQTVRPFGP